MPERLNIKSLVIEPDHKSEQTFDPEREVTSADWKEFSALLVKYKQQNEWGIALQVAKDMYVLGQPPTFTEDEWQLIDQQYKHDMLAHGEPPGHVLAAEKLLGKTFTNFDQVHWRVVSALEMKKARERQSWLDLLQSSSDMMLFGEEPHLEKSDLTLIKRSLDEELLNSRQLNPKTMADPWAVFVKHAAQARLIGLNTVLNGEDWSQIREELASARAEGNWGTVLDMASNLAILAADEIHIPPGGGLELIKKDKLTKPETPPLPEQRKF